MQKELTTDLGPVGLEFDLYVRTSCAMKQKQNCTWGQEI